MLQKFLRVQEQHCKIKCSNTTFEWNSPSKKGKLQNLDKMKYTFMVQMDPKNSVETENCEI